MHSVNISEFILFRKEGSEHYTGYAKYFGLRQWDCIIRKTAKSFVVLVRENGQWIPIGMFYPYHEPQKVRGDKIYECIGEIWTPHHTFYLLKDDKYYFAI